MVRTQVNTDGTTTVWIALNENCTKWSMKVVKGNATPRHIDIVKRIRDTRVLPFIYDPNDFNKGAMSGELGRSNNIHGELSQ